MSDQHGQPGHIHRLEIVFTCGNDTIRRHAEGDDEKLAGILREVADALWPIKDEVGDD